MTDLTFEAALNDRTNEMLDACTRCANASRSARALSRPHIKDAAPADVIAGIIDFVRARRPGNLPAMGDVLTLRRLHRGVRRGRQSALLLAMARVAISRRHFEPPSNRDGLTKYRDTSRSDRLSQLQLERAALERARQGWGLDRAGRGAGLSSSTPLQRLRTPHIALLALDIMDS